MIAIYFENTEAIQLPSQLEKWIAKIIQTESKKLGAVNYIFCDDSYLLEINRKYLAHDDYTDIITFDLVKGKVISGDIFVSLQRLRENAQIHDIEFKTELLRVVAHGIYHLCGYKDKTPEEVNIMRSKEEFAINLYLALS